MLQNAVSNSALLSSRSLCSIGWMASDPDNLLVLLKTFSLPFFPSPIDPISLFFPFPNQLIFFPAINFPLFHSKHDCYWLSHVDWHPPLLSLSTRPISSMPTTILVPSPLSPIAPLPSCIRGRIFLNASSMLFLLKPIVIHRKHREEGLFSCKVLQDFQQCWLDAFQCSSSHH